MDINALDSTASESFEIDTTQPTETTTMEESDTTPMIQDVDGISADSDGFFDEELVAHSDQEEVTEEVVEPKEESVPDSEPSKLSIDINGKPIEFNLNPEDETLRRTLRKGAKFDKIKADRQSLNAELTSVKEQLSSASEASEVFESIKEHISEGELEYVVQSVLGDKYADFMESQIEDYIRYQESTPAERATMDMERKNKTISQSERAKDKQLKSLQEQLETKDMDIQTEKYQGQATDALRQNQFSKEEVADKSKRHSLNKRIWQNSWDTIKTLNDKGRDISPKLMQKVFARESKLLKDLVGDKLADVSKVEEQKQQVAQQTAATIATRNYPASKPNTKVGGKSIRQLMDMLK